MKQQACTSKSLATSNRSFLDSLIPSFFGLRLLVVGRYQLLAIREGFFALAIDLLQVAGDRTQPVAEFLRLPNQFSLNGESLIYVSGRPSGYQLPGHFQNVVALVNVVDLHVPYVLDACYKLSILD